MSRSNLIRTRSGPVSRASVRKLGCGSANTKLTTPGDSRRGGRHRWTPLIWEEPSPELENQVVALISGSQVPADMSRTRMQRWLRPLAASPAMVVAVALFASLRSPSPDWVVAMPGTDLAPPASSTVSGWDTDSGTQTPLSIDGLDRAPEGYGAELWLSRGPLSMDSTVTAKRAGGVGFGSR